VAEVLTMNSKWMKRLNASRAWIFGAGLLAAGIAWFVQR
jgi:hypothetical protein